MSRVKIDGLHPRFIARLGPFLLILALRTVSSARRPFLRSAEILYDGYVGKRGFNLAANPDRKLERLARKLSYGPAIVRGFGYAVDLRITGKGITTAKLKKSHPVRHARPVRSEWCTPEASSAQVRGLPYDASAEPPSPDPKDVLAEVAKFVEACKDTVLRRGDRGAVVEFLQTQLDRTATG